MASILTKLWSKLNPKKIQPSIMIVGLDNSGKTSILRHLMTHGGSQCQKKRGARRKADRSAPPRESTLSIVDAQDNFESQFNGRQLDEVGVDLAGLGGPKCGSRSSTPIDFTEPIGASGSRSVSPTIGYNYEQIQLRSLTLTVLDFSGQSKYRTLWQEFYNSVDAIVFVIDSTDLIRLVVVRDELECMLSHPQFTSLVNKSTLENQRPMEAGDNSYGSLKSSLASKGADSSLAQKQLTISQGRLVQSPLDTVGQQTSTNHTASSARKQSSNTNNNCYNPKKCHRTKIPVLFLANKSDLPNSVDTEVIVKALNLTQLPGDRHPWLIRATSVTSGQGIGDAFEWLISQLTQRQDL